MNDNLNKNPLGGSPEVETLDFMPNENETALASTTQSNDEMQPQVLNDSPSLNPEQLTSVPPQDLSLSPEPTISQQVNDNEFEYHKPKKKINLKMVLIIVIILAVLGVGGFFGYKILCASPYSVYQKVINELFALGRPYFKNETEDINLTYSGNIKLETNIDGMEDFNDYSYDYSLGIDTKNQKAEVMLGLNEKDKTILDLFVYLLDGKGYLKSEALTDYLLDGGSAEVEFNNESNIEDGLYLYNKVESMLLNAFTKEDFQNKNTTIKVDGAHTKVKDNYLVISPSLFDKAVKRMINILKTDEKSVQILAKYMEATEDDLVSMFDALLNTDYTTTEINMTIHFYTSGLFNKLSGFSLEVDNKQMVYAGFDGEKGTIEINLDSIVISAAIDGNITSVTVSAESEVIASGKITKVNDSEMKCEFNIGEMAINVSIISKEESNNVSTQTMKIEVISGETNVKVTIDNKFEENKEIANIDTSNAKDVNDLTDAEKEEITDKFTSIIESTAFYPYLQLIFGSYDDIYNDSYYDDYYGDSYFDDSNFDNFDDDSYFDESDDFFGSMEEYSPACDYAICGDCSEDTCECEYYDNNFELQTIICPNEMYY